METAQNISDARLVCDTQKGSHEAFSELVRRHSDYLYRITWRTCPDVHMAEDIVQDAFLKFWKNPKSFDSARGAAFRTWITRVALNRALDVLKKKTPVPDYDYLMQQSLDDPNIPLHELETKVRAMEIEQAIQELPESQKTALNLCYYEDMKRKDAAEAMDISDKALESLLSRARKKLLSVLIKRGYSHEA